MKFPKTESMMLTSKKIYKSSCLIFVFLLLSAVLLVQPSSLMAQGVQTLSVTPTLFEMSASPGQVWHSSVKVVNSNKFDLVVYAGVVNFAPEGESGHGKFLPVFEEMTEGSTLAEWVDITNEQIVIAPEESKSIPFVVTVPEDASPGGHFAAILISTQPPEPEDGKLLMRTTQVVSSLFFVRIDGDVIEQGTIRSFTTERAINSMPEATFSLRFENKGNVHLQPRGEIAIFNMWGEERGKIPINHQTHFGNVLPNSIRNFEFTWKGERSFADFGRYRAVASLGYGLGATQYVTSSVYFWVIPVKPILITLGSAAAFVFFVFWAIKLYVRRMLQMAGVTVTRAPRATPAQYRPSVERGDVRLSSYKTISAPVRSGYLDFRERLAGSRKILDVFKVLLSFVLSYRIFFISAAVVVVGIIAFVLFLAEVTEKDRSYEISIENPERAVELTSEEIKYNEMQAIHNLPDLGANSTQSFTLDIVNTSGVAGVGAEAAANLAQQEFSVESIKTVSGRVDKTTSIVFDPVLQDTAIELSKFFGGALISARVGSSTEKLPNVTVFVGGDQVTR